MANNNKKIKNETNCELVSQPNSICGTAYQSTNKTKQNKTKQNKTKQKKTKKKQKKKQDS